MKAWTARALELLRASLEPPKHELNELDWKDHEAARLLLVHVPESAVKPVHLRGKKLEEAFIRSAGTTRKASRQEIGTLMLNSRTPRWEELHASVLLPDAEFTKKLNVEPIFRMLERPLTSGEEEALAWMASERFIVREPAGGGYVTNLGAIAAARKLADFPDLSRKAVRVVVYDGQNKARTKQEQEGTRGYAISFQGLIEFIMALLPQSEVIAQALRQKRKFSLFGWCRF